MKTADTPTILVRFFASLREATGRDELRLAIDAPCSVEVLLDRLSQELPADAMQALREMSTLLAERHRRVMATTDVSPGDCKLPLDAFAPGQEFSKGLLLSLVSDSEIRQLVEFRRDDDIDSALFEAPPGFGRFEMP